MALWRIDSELYAKTCFALMIHRATAQAYPGRDTVVDAAKSLATASGTAVKQYIRAINPWMTAEELSLEEAERKELENSAAEMIRAWIAYFEPENLQAYQEQLKREAGDTHAG